MNVKMLWVVVFFISLSFFTAKGSEVKMFESIEAEVYGGENATQIAGNYSKYWTPTRYNTGNSQLDRMKRIQIEKWICNAFKGKNSIKSLCEDVEDLEGSLRRKTKTFNDAITLACEGLTWQQNTQKKRLCLKLGFDGKSEDKACRVFGDEPIDNDNGITVKDLCARIERLNTKITNGIDSLKATTKAICKKKNFGKKTKKGRLCIGIKHY